MVASCPFYNTQGLFDKCFMILLCPQLVGHVTARPDHNDLSTIKEKIYATACGINIISLRDVNCTEYYHFFQIFFDKSGISPLLERKVLSYKLAIKIKAREHEEAAGQNGLILKRGIAAAAAGGNVLF